MLFTFGSEGISYVPGAVAVKIQETTRKKYVSRWACTLTVRPDGTMHIADGTPHDGRPTGLLKVDGVKVEAAEVTPGSRITLSDRFTLDTSVFAHIESSQRLPVTMVDADKRREFESLKQIERKYNIWDKVDMISSRYGFMSLSPIAFSAIRAIPITSKTLVISLLLFALFTAVTLYASRMKRRYADLYRCPHCHKKLTGGSKLRAHDDLCEDNECPRCHKLFFTEYAKND